MITPLSNSAARPAPTRTMERLSQPEYYRLYKWLEAKRDANGFVPGVTNATVAHLATEELGFKCTEWIIRGALETTGVTLPPLKRVVPADEAVKRLAQVTDGLLDGLLLYGKLDEVARAMLSELRSEIKELL